MIGAFCALLELVKIGVVTAQQPSQTAEIEVVFCEKAEGDFDDIIRSSTFMDEETEESETLSESLEAPPEGDIEGNVEGDAAESEESGSKETAPKEDNA